jgi:hypothetical protein
MKKFHSINSTYGLDKINQRSVYNDYPGSCYVPMVIHKERMILISMIVSDPTQNTPGDFTRRELE